MKRLMGMEVVVKGKCIVCGKNLEEEDGLFLCNACQQKNKEWNEKERTSETDTTKEEE